MQEKKLERHLAKVGKLSEEKLVEIFEEIQYSAGYVLNVQIVSLCLSASVCSEVKGPKSLNEIKRRPTIAVGESTGRVRRYDSNTRSSCTLK